jgi:hypothetical protein
MMFIGTFLEREREREREKLFYWKKFCFFCWITIEVSVI